MQFANYGQERERIATESEVEIFELLQQMAGVELRLVRVSDNYVTAKYGEWDLARIKYTNKAKWVFFPIFETQKERHVIKAPEDVAEFAELVAKSIEHIKKYS